jgi:ferredoxin-NADP reductase
MATPIKTKARISRLINVDDQLFALDLIPEKRIPKFKAGQFLHLALDEYDEQGGYWPDSRVFSIASPPGSNTISLFFSVKGEFTQRMADELFRGKTVWLKFPYGNFIIEEHIREASDLILVAGGTGIAPFLSGLLSIKKVNPNQQIQLVYGIRKQEYLLHIKQLRAIVQQIPTLKISLFMEEKSLIELSNCKIKEGKISQTFLEELVKKCDNPITFLSGPPEMMNTCRATLLAGGQKRESIIIDEWE